MLTKDEIFVRETYTPPQGEKDIYLFPRIFGGDTHDKYDFYTKFNLKADRTTKRGRLFWEITVRMDSEYYGRNLGSIESPLTTDKILKLLNNQFSSLYKDVIVSLFKGTEK